MDSRSRDRAMSWEKEVRDERNRCFLSLMILLVTLTAIGCGRPFRAPARIPLLPGNLAAHTTVRHLTIEATAILDEDELLRLFNANLRLARLLIVEVNIVNRGSRPVDLRRVRFTLEDADGHRFRPLKPRKAVKKLYKYYRIKNYVIYFRKQLEADFERRRLSLGEPLSAGERRRGFLYFEFPREVDPLNRIDRLTLRLEGLEGTADGGVLELQLRRKGAPIARDGVNGGFPSSSARSELRPPARARVESPIILSA